jgi:hypothetical protein
VVSLKFFFSEATDGTMCPGVDSASKNEYSQEFPYHLNSAESRENPEFYPSGSPKGLLRPVAGKLYLYLLLVH